MSFADLFPNEMIIDMLGEAVDYKADKNSVAVSIMAIVDHDLSQATAGDSYRPQPRVTVSTLKANIPGVKKGSTFTQGDRVMTVDAFDSDDGQVVVMVVK